MGGTKKQPRGGRDPRKTSENQMRRGRGRQEGEKRRLNRGQQSEGGTGREECGRGGVAARRENNGRIHCKTGNAS